MNIDEKLNLSEVLNLFFANKTDGIHTILPGQIISYDGHSTRKAEVKPMVKLRNVHNQIIEIDPIKNVPVLFPSTKNFNFLFPLNKNDGCLLLFAESSIGNFLLNATNNATDADDLNRFDLSDCICIPGLWSFKNLPIAPENDTDFWLQFQDSKIQIKDSTNEIIIEDKLGNKFETSSTGMKMTDLSSNILELLSTGIKMLAGTESFVKGDTLATALLALCTTIATATSGTIAQNTAGIETIKTAFSTFNGQINNFKSTKIKGE